MQTNYIVRTKDLYSFYHTPERGILYRVHQNGRWGREQPLFPGARGNYTVSLDGGGAIYLFCQDQAGDIVLCTGENGEFKPRTILKNQSNKIYTIQLYPIISPEGICLIYNLPEENNYIAIQHSTDSKSWSKPRRIDKFASLNDRMFAVQQVADDHHLLFYQTRGAEVSLGYREITPAEQGRYHVFYGSAHPVLDTSFLTTGDSVHTLYIHRAMFSSQLIYRKNEGGEFSPPIMLCEGQKLDNCLLYCIGGRLYAAFVNGAGQLYICKSDDMGGQFSQPEIYKKKFCLSPVKAEYISYEPMDVKRFFLRQVYVDMNSPYDIQLVPDLYDEFYPLPEKAQAPEEGISELRIELELLKSRSREQSQQITYLTDLLHSRNQ